MNEHGTPARSDTAVATRLRRALQRAQALAAPQVSREQRLVSALQYRIEKRVQGAAANAWAPGAKEAKREPLEYMQLCRKYLAKLDTLGWNRSYHQRLFHDDFLKACTRSFWKLESPGQFARDHQKVLRVNSWDHIAQEILISTPRRFGKTISVSMFCAAMMLACPGVEISIYSTCKRISQKILRNVQKFALMIADSDYGTLNFSVKRENMEEINLQGPLGNTDVRIINSYPSKVCLLKQQSSQMSKSPLQKSSNVEKYCARVPSGLPFSSVHQLRLGHHAQLVLGERERRRVHARQERENALQQIDQERDVVVGGGERVLQQEEQVAGLPAAVQQRELGVLALARVNERPANVDFEQCAALRVHVPAEAREHSVCAVGLLHKRHSSSRLCSRCQNTGTSCSASQKSTAAIVSAPCPAASTAAAAATTAPTRRRAGPVRRAARAQDTPAWCLRRLDFEIWAEFLTRENFDAQKNRPKISTTKISTRKKIDRKSRRRKSRRVKFSVKLSDSDAGAMEMELDDADLNSQCAWPGLQDNQIFDSDLEGPMFDESELPNFTHPCEPEPEPCHLLRVFGPEDEWRGKHYFAVEYAGKERGILCLQKWPMHHLLAMCSTQHLLMLASTCRTMRRATHKVLDARAHDDIASKYFGESQLIKFVDAFGFFGWAMSLSSWLNATDMRSWRAEELDAAYDFLAQKVDIDEVAHLRGLRPHAAMCWKVQGRKALENFISDCVAEQATHRKLLAHYDSAWKSIRKILELNASLLRARSFAGTYGIVRQLHASWPSVTVTVEIFESAASHNAQALPDVWTWTKEDVKNWMRLKKLPIRGVLEVGLNGAELLRCCLSEKTARTKITAPFPLGLGMEAAHENRCRFLVQQMLAQAGAPMRSESFIFRVGEQKAG